MIKLLFHFVTLIDACSPDSAICFFFIYHICFLFVISLINVHICHGFSSVTQNSWFSVFRGQIFSLSLPPLLFVLHFGPSSMYLTMTHHPKFLTAISSHKTVTTMGFEPFLLSGVEVLFLAVIKVSPIFFFFFFSIWLSFIWDSQYSQCTARLRHSHVKGSCRNWAGLPAYFSFSYMF